MTSSMEFPLYDALICSHRGIDKLPHIVNSLLNQTLPPENIIICSTSYEDILDIPISQLTYITHILSPIANQVVQRAIGVTHCQSPYIFQLDDDLTLDINCSKNLLEFLLLRPNSIVSPLISVNTNEYVPQGINWLNACKSNPLTSFYLSLQGFNFSRPKSLKVLKFGSIVPLINKPDHPERVDWLHSCRMYRKESAFLVSAMLSHGKSYFEDIYSSAEYISLGYNLFLLPDAIAYHPSVSAISSKDGIGMLTLQYAALKKFAINKFMLSFTMILTFMYRLFISKRY